MGLSRLALTDEFISLCQVATIWLFFELVRAPRKWLVWSLFVVVFAFTILTKEISVLLGIPFTVFALIERFYAERDVPAGRIAAALALPVAITIVVWIAAAGGFETLARTIEIVIGSPATNQYAIQMGSGPWYRYVVDELLVSPWPTLLGLAGVALTVWRWRENDYDAARVHLVLIYVFQIAVLSFFTKNLRYIAVLEAPLRVLAVLAIWDLCASRRAAIARALPCAIVALLCWLDWQNFQQVFITWQTYDPVSVQLGAARQLFPMAQPGK
jgi:4-amino-4-deoxy-L-arabinose transferase-like glycosyltransferase